MILKIALITLAVVLGLSIFDAILVGLIYLARFGFKRKESEERRMNDEPITETSMHHLICAMCDNAKCVRGTKECEFEKWKKEQESEEE
jgi:hypothetical protein